jgi:hypothetical protein
VGSPTSPRCHTRQWGNSSHATEHGEHERVTAVWGLPWPDVAPYNEFLTGEAAAVNSKFRPLVNSRFVLGQRNCLVSAERLANTDGPAGVVRFTSKVKGI